MKIDDPFLMCDIEVTKIKNISKKGNFLREKFFI